MEIYYLLLPFYILLLYITYHQLEIYVYFSIVGYRADLASAL